MKIMFLFLLGWANFALATDSNCSVSWAGTKAEKLKLTKVAAGHRLEFPDAQNVFTVRPDKDRLTFEFVNSSVDLTNHRTYSLVCKQHGSSCAGEMRSTFNGKRTQRKLSPSPGTRSTLYKDGGSKVLEVQITNKGHKFKFLNHSAGADFGDLEFRCDP